MSIRVTFAFILAFIIAPTANTRLTAQLLWEDHFSPGNTVTTTNAWQGDVADFEVNAAGQLHLNAPVAGSSTLVLPYQVDDSLRFSAWFRMDFAPSATNILQFWLSASTPDLSTADGYYLEMGENGNLDAIKLMKRSAGIATLVSTGASGALANQPAQAAFRVTRRSTGLFTLDADYLGTTNLVLQFSATDTEIATTGTKYAGVFCLYTDTRKDKYYFDDIALERLRPDLTPPQATTASILDAQTVQLNINETATLTNTIRAIAQPGNLTTPNLSITTSGNGYIALFSTPFVSGTNYTFYLLSAADADGNIADTLVYTANYIAYETALAGDVILNEIFPDPTPSFGLPDYEYIEIVNRSGKYLKGDAITIRDGTSAAIKLTGVVLAPGDIHVLVGAGAGQNLPAGVKYTAITGLPTLNNDGETITLANLNGETIDAITYDLTWYRDAVKDDGGYALERINPTLPCSDSQNWKASTAPIGGTPGAQNSVYDLTPDTTPPTIISAKLTAPKVLTVMLSEPAAEPVVFNPAAWFINPPDTEVSSVTKTGSATYVLQLQSEPKPGVLYTVFPAGITDCSGNLDAREFPFGVIETAVVQDLVINEFLFNPQTGSSRFVEIVNISNTFIDLAQCRFIGGEIGFPKLVQITAPIVLAPDSMVVLTPDVADILQRYPLAHPKRLYKNDLPTLPDDAGTLAIECFAGTVVTMIDSFDYSKTWHSPFLSSTAQEGVSLEKLDLSLPGVLRSSWISAASPNNGTPTGPNSQKVGINPVTGADLIKLDANRLSPDGDGYEDFLSIQYQLPESGYFGAMQIFDSEGNLIKKLANAVLFGQNGVIRWDGDNDDGAIERPGIYLLFFELVSPQGKVFRTKNVVTLVKRF
jgi:Lamin Tail Domain